MPLAKRSIGPFRKIALLHTAIALVVLFVPTICGAQTANAPGNPLGDELKKYPGLAPELGKLADRMKNEVSLPPDRDHSRLLPLLPEATTYYAAFPNYGDAAHQALNIFQQELKESAVLREWLLHGENGVPLSQVEEGVEKFYEFSQYLGDEIVVSGDTSAARNSFALLAEVRKPGLKSFLQQLIQQWSGNTKPMVRLFEPQELAQADKETNMPGLVILVRPDLVVAGPSVEALKAFNALLDRRNATLPSTPFGQRLALSYQGGVGVLVAADLQRITSQLPGEQPQNQDMLNRAGFDNAKFFVWEHKTVANQAVSRAELSFDGPRHGIASWLLAPGPLGSLDFVSPEAVSVATVRLKNLAEIFDGVLQLAATANPNAFASLNQMQQMMNINLRNDLLNHLQGEITLEFDGLVAQQPEWKAIFRVTDPERLQQTLGKLLAASGQGAKPSTGEDGTKFYSVVVPSAGTPMQITYTFADSYLVIASTRELASQAIQTHNSGTSFAKSSKFTSAAPQGRSGQASGLLYYDPVSMSALRMQAASPEVTQMLSHMQSSPVIVRAYGDEDAIRVASNSGGADAAVILGAAAIAVPNLLRAKTSANEAMAVGTMRTIVTAQVTYSATYPERGFARELIALGADPSGTNETAPEHAGLMDWTHGEASCPAKTWCTKSDYRFSMVSRCMANKCYEFTALATPLSNNSGVRSFCVTSDGVLRFNLATPSTPTISTAECRRWAPLQ